MWPVHLHYVSLTEFGHIVGEWRLTTIIRGRSYTTRVPDYGTAEAARREFAHTFMGHELSIITEQYQPWRSLVAGAGA